MKAHVWVAAKGAEFGCRLTVGVQTFDINDPREDRAEAVWIGDMLAKALTNAGAEVSREWPGEGHGRPG